MNDLLKEAIADAKAVKEVALANAKLALEEAFTPRLQSMLSQKLAEEAEAEEPVEEGEGEEEAPVEEYGFYGEGEDEEPAMEEGEGEEEEAPMEEGEDEEAPVEEAEEEEAPVEEGEDEEEPMDEELMEIIRQLEEDIDSSEIGSGDNKKPSAVASDDSTEDKKEKLVQLVEEEDEDSEEVAEIKEILRALREEEGEEEKVEEGEDEEEVDIKEVLRALREEEEEEKVEEAEEEKEKEMAESKLREAYAVITFLRSKINEVNLLNSKLLFSNKLFRKHSLNEKQKMTVIENFDRASSLREVKLVYATLSESLRTTKVKPIKESFASKPTASTRPSKPILNEGDDMANRLRKLAGLK
jgi:hypothetical protein